MEGGCRSGRPVMPGVAGAGTTAPGGECGTDAAGRANLPIDLGGKLACATHILMAAPVSRVRAKRIRNQVAGIVGVGMLRGCEGMRCGRGRRRTESFENP